MKILVTGAKGFVGKNLCAQLKNIKDGKARCYGDLTVSEVYEYDIDSTAEELDSYCRDCNFVFNLAGVNRPQNTEEFMQGNFGFVSTLLDTLKKHGNNSPVMLSSSAQASLTGRFGNSEYGRSKKAGEDLFLKYGAEVGARVLVYRFPNLYGKWCRPNYNSAVATFCNNIANDLPITVNDPSVELELLYIDDLVEEMIIVDTGSTDRTMEIAKSYPKVKLYEFAWIDDFAAARNFAFSKATQEYIYSADADEVLDEENRKRFLLLKQALLPEVEIVQMKYGNQLEFGTVYNYDEEYRPKLFKRLREFKWHEAIRETINITPVIYDSDVVITHLPK